MSETPLQSLARTDSAAWKEYRELATRIGKLNEVIRENEIVAAGWRGAHHKTMNELNNAERKIKKLEDKLSALQQVTGELCPLCGWAMRFPGELCRCELQKRVEELEEQVAFPVCKTCGWLHIQDKKIKELEAEVLSLQPRVFTEWEKT